MVRKGLGLWVGILYIGLKAQSVQDGLGKQPKQLFKEQFLNNKMYNA